MFELVDDEPSKCGPICGLVRFFLSALLLAAAWVLVGVMFKVCALLFLLGWDLV